MYAAFLTNTDGKHYKSYFVVADVANFGGSPFVSVAWGRIGVVNDDRTYEGPKGRAFADYKHAERYARAIVKSKRIDEEYVLNWSTDEDVEWPKLSEGYPDTAGVKILRRYDGEVPRWFQDRAEGSLLGGKFKVKIKNVGTAEEKPKKKRDDESYKERLERLKAKLRSTAKAAGDAEDDDDDPPKKVLAPVGPKPSYSTFKRSSFDDPTESTTVGLKQESPKEKVHEVRRRPRFTFIPRKDR